MQLLALLVHHIVLGNLVALLARLARLVVEGPRVGYRGGLLAVFGRHDILIVLVENLDCLSVLATV